MKKKALSIILAALGLLNGGSMWAQNTPQNERYEQLQRQAEDMMRQMSDQFKMFFNDSAGFRPHIKGFSFDNLDSLSSGDFADALPFGRQDTSFSRAFGFLFDGNQWQEWGGKLDSLGQSPRAQEFEAQVESLLRGMTRDDFFQFPVLPQFGTPNWPYERRKQPEEGDKKDKKYKTERL